MAWPASLFAQQAIDGNFAFQTDPAKKYSLYIPSGYQDGTPHRLMLGLHPFNTNRWDSESWRDTLIVFAETNNLLLVCPDGGADGQVDDAIDTAFTSALLDSVRNWYTIDTRKTYAMGFSWGARTTYTYGLSHASWFGGFLPIGAAINGTNEVTEPLQQAAAGKPVYIIHGSQDAPNARFFPVRDSLISKGAIVETNYLSGVGHTIDFANRNQILTVGFQWIDSVNCLLLGDVELPALASNGFEGIFPSHAKPGDPVRLALEVPTATNFKLEVFGMNGQLMMTEERRLAQGTDQEWFTVGQWPAGAYLVRVWMNGVPATQKLMVK